MSNASLPSRARTGGTKSQTCELLEPRKLFSSVVHQELHRPPVVMVTWGKGAALRVATAAHGTDAKGNKVIAVDVFGNVGPDGALAPLSHTDCDDNDPAAAIYVAAGDVNGDGFTDIALKRFSVVGQPTPVGESFNSTITILGNDGKDGFTPRSTFVIPHILEKSALKDNDLLDKIGVAVGDVNHDGDTDVVSWTGDSCDVVALTSRGPRQTVSLDGTFGANTRKGNGRIAGLGDLDSDGTFELVGFDEDAPTVFYASLKDPAGIKLVKRIEIDVAKKNTHLDGCVPCDLDGDAFTDDLVLFSGNDVFLGTNKGKIDPTGATTPSFSWDLTQLPKKVESLDVLVGDVNGDGKGDLFTVTGKTREFTGHVTLIK